MRAMEQRIEALEGALRSWRRAAKIAGLTCAVIAGGILAVALASGVPAARGGQGKPQEPETGGLDPRVMADYRPRTLEADRIVLLDHRGRQRIVLEGGGGRPGVILMGAKGKERLRLTVSHLGPRIELLDAEERARAGLRVAGESAYLELGGTGRDGGHAPVALLHRSDRADGLVLAGAERGEPAVSVVREHGGDGRLEINGKAGTTSVAPHGFRTAGTAGAAATLGTHDGNVCIFSLYDREEKARAAIRLRADPGQHTLEVNGPDERSGIQLLARREFSTLQLTESARDGGSLDLRIDNGELISPRIQFHKNVKVPGGTMGTTPFLLGMRARDSHPYMVMRDAAGDSVTVAPEPQ